MNDDARLDCSDYPEPQHEGDYIRELETKLTDQQKLIEQLVGACDIASSRLPWDSSAKKMCDDALAAAKQQKGKSNVKES